ncbi:MAG: hypothetical protein IK041_04520 [Bacteroidales bacterium]|nr:hypothetical protein [Bacteroidales bacterium]
MKKQLLVIAIGLVFSGFVSAQTRQEIYCFNQRYICSEGGKFGMLDKHKKEVLPMVYDEVSFLTDDIAILSRYGGFLLCDKWGRIFAEGSSREGLEERCQDLYDQVLEEDRLYWETVLDAYTEFRDSCIRLRGKPSAEAQLLPQKQKIEELLKLSRGRMTEDQMARFKSIAEGYSAPKTQ